VTDAADEDSRVKLADKSFSSMRTREVLVSLSSVILPELAPQLDDLVLSPLQLHSRQLLPLLLHHLLEAWNLARERALHRTVSCLLEDLFLVVDVNPNPRDFFVGVGSYP
jgi:hypothetical protein